MITSRAALVLVLALTACAGQPEPANSPAGPSALLLRDVTLIDGTGASPREHVSVLVRSGIIEEVGESLEVPGARIVEGRGRFLIPGLWDTHVHVLLDGDPLADIKNVGRISAVVLRGKLLERADLDRLLEAATR
jgi:hypothetical protein